jgi:hypothetical protein
MPINVTCPGCQYTSTAPDDFAGKRVKCRTCGASVDIPSFRGGIEFRNQEPLELPAVEAEQPTIQPERKAHPLGFLALPVVAIVCLCVGFCFALLVNKEPKAPLPPAPAAVAIDPDPAVKSDLVKGLENRLLHLERAQYFAAHPAWGSSPFLVMSKGAKLAISTTLLEKGKLQPFVGVGLGFLIPDIMPFLEIDLGTPSSRVYGSALREIRPFLNPDALIFTSDYPSCFKPGQQAAAEEVMDRWAPILAKNCETFHEETIRYFARYPNPDDEH